MAVPDLSRDRVEERLGALEEGYASFTVNQTTLSVSPEAYERTRARSDAGLTDVYVQIYGEDGDVLLVEKDDGWVIPHVKPGLEESLELGTRRAVAADTGVECRITDLERVTILGVRDETDPERDPVYRLVTIFVGERVSGSPGEAVAWHSSLPDAALPDP